MKRDWIQYFKDRAAAVITQPDDFAPVIRDQQPPMPKIGNVGSPNELMFVAVLQKEFARLAANELLQRVMVRH